MQKSNKIKYHILIFILLISITLTGCKNTTTHTTYKIRLNSILINPEIQGYNGQLDTIQIAILENGYAKYDLWTQRDVKNRWGIITQKFYELENNTADLIFWIYVTKNNETYQYSETIKMYLTNTGFKSENNQEYFYFLGNDNKPSQKLYINSEHYIGTNLTITFGTY